jgi:hypothetical protein
VPFSRRILRGCEPIAASRETNVSRLGGDFRYSIMTGSSPEARIIARTLRAVPQAGL